MVDFKLCNEDAARLQKLDDYWLPRIGQ